MNDKFYNNLKDDLKPYYSKGDCCSWIVELRKENKQLESNWNSLREWIEEQQKEVFHIGDKIGIVDSVSIDVLLDKMNELEGKDKE